MTADSQLDRLQTERQKLMKMHNVLISIAAESMPETARNAIEDACAAISEAFGRISTARLRLGYGRDE